jgi:hypothetical protein
MIGVHVPGVGHVPVRVRRSLGVHNQDGSSELRVFLDIEVPPRPPDGGGGEPMPLESAA